MYEEGDVTYCFQIRKLYNYILSGNLNNPYTGKPFVKEFIATVIDQYIKLGPWEALHHKTQPLNKTRGLSPEVVIGLKLMQFGLTNRPWKYGAMKNKPFLLIGTIPVVSKNLEGIFAARLGINSDIIVSPRKIDTVVNMRDYKGMMVTCNIWEKCDIPKKEWGGIYFNHIPLGTVKQVAHTIATLATQLQVGGILMYQTDIYSKSKFPAGKWDKIKEISSLLGAKFGVARWNHGSYAWIILQRK